MADKRWKKVERDKCRALGAERSGPTGRDLPDCEGLCIGLEIKSYKKFVFLTADWRQAKENAAKLGQPPVLAVKEAGRGGRDIVQMHEAHWMALEIGAASDCFIVSDEIPTQHVVDGDIVVRMPWDYFVALYRAYYKQEALIG